MSHRHLRSSREAPGAPAAIQTDITSSGSLLTPSLPPRDFAVILLRLPALARLTRKSQAGLLVYRDKQLLYSKSECAAYRDNGMSWSKIGILHTS